MPDVVSRWQGELAKYPALARDTKEATVWGASVPLSSKVMSPQLVVTTAVKVLPAAVALSGLL